MGLANRQDESSRESAPLVSVVIPCLDEVRSIGTCVRKAIEALATMGVSAEVVVVDNGSTDGSADVACAAGAVVVHEATRGYGAAYLTGFRAGRLIVTEFGVARLRGTTVRQRAEALAAIAHPDHREALRVAAAQLG